MRKGKLTMRYYTATIKTRYAETELNITAGTLLEAEELANQFALKHWGDGYELMMSTAEPRPPVTVVNVNFH